MSGWLPVCVVVVLSVVVLWRRVGAAQADTVRLFDRQFNRLRRVMLMSAQDTVNAVVAQIRRGTGEVLDKIADLQAQVDAGEKVDLSELAAAAQALDDIVADGPVEVPVDAPVEVGGGDDGV